MKNLLSGEQFGFMRDADKEFIIAFNEQMNHMGYDCGNEFKDGVCWGIFMLIYTKTSVKSNKCYCRIYIRKEGIALRLYLSRVDHHRAYLKQAPEHIKTAFTGDWGNCGHCHNETEGVCRHRKTYCIDENQYEKCDGYTFEFWDTDAAKVPDYLALLNEFYPQKTRRA